MNWTPLPTDYTDAVWTGMKKYNMIQNEDDTVSLQDVTVYSNRDKSFFGAKDANQMNSALNEIAKEINQIANYIYPVGSYYISHNRTSPAQLFGGTWLRVTDRFLWGCSSTETIGSTGGEKTHTLTTSEIPPHAHYLPNSNNAGETQNYTLTYNPNAKGLAGTLKTKNTGEGGAHNNMPPYVNVAIWRRIA